MSFDTNDIEMFFSLETSLHRPKVRSSPQAVSDLLADDFVEFGKSGRVYDKQITIEALAQEEGSVSTPPLEVADFTAKPLSEDVVLVTYKSIRPLAQDQQSNEALRSSIWKRIDGRWQMIFHQGTPVPV
ncbi:DUF4440 domain-containing protein [Rhizobium sp. RM]|uniref:nuclear transport factor 2 family protein n=1 Tax=Rhizobium sp. RM TaxID=2748079 RepID=UPI00110D8F3E|nr:DUF4440 domain-containing protein [Rhizobium sp. RM]NWJ26108.1 DUF4440 domain-containing protein [Rhizobium sp. RM]TMV20703.1 DUF4440 domain-containing protein [Rhizobium sp. Td3]